MKQYKWNGKIFQIAGEDLKRYPGAVAIEPEKKVKAEPKNKARKPKAKQED